MTVWQTVLIFVVIPAAIIGVIALLTEMPSIVRGPRYRSGQPWTYKPVWWAGSPSGHAADTGLGAVRRPEPRSVTERATASAQGTVKTARGGARGNW
ncbi:MAG TPA: hypothetical protein VF444_09915 [Pseudonocardiaceae bacterium]